MNGRRAGRWFVIALFAGLGTWLFLGSAWSLFTNCDSVPVPGVAEFIFLGFQCIVAAVLLHWAYLLAVKQYREFAAVFSCALALIAAACLITLPTWRVAFQRYDAWLQSTDRHPLAILVGLGLVFAMYAVPYVVGRWVFRRGQSLLLKMFGEPATGGRLLR